MAMEIYNIFNFSPMSTNSNSANYIRKLWITSNALCHNLAAHGYPSGVFELTLRLAELRVPLEGDEYDYLGRNISAQERRQDLEQWVLVDRGGLEDDNMSSYGVEEDEPHPIADCMWPEYLSAMLGP